MGELFATEDPLLPLLYAGALSFVFSAVLYPFYIKWLRSKQIEQFIREEGPATHAAKAKTPTMGGLCFIAGILLVSAFAMIKCDHVRIESNEIIRASYALGAAFLCGLLGFADDYGKVTSKSNKGISGKLRLICEFVLGLALGLALYFTKAIPDFLVGLSVANPTPNVIAFSALPPELQWLYFIVLVPCIMASTTNALNLHDGMDGLAAGTSAIVFCSMAVLLTGTEHAVLSWVAAATAGGLFAFLIYNRNPARVFMGDTGSLFLGALMAGIVVGGGLLIWFLPMALIYIVETISVIAQVVYFKLTKNYEPEQEMSKLQVSLYKLTHKLPGEGKRLFRMAPIHHHFEALAHERGQKEADVVLWFWIVQLAICAMVLSLTRLF